jgi:hypothetical protein
MPVSVQKTLVSLGTGVLGGEGNHDTQRGQLGNKGRPASGRCARAHIVRSPYPLPRVPHPERMRCEQKCFLLTVELLEDSVNGARAAAAAHGDVELVSVVLSHCDECGGLFCVGLSKGGVRGVF